MGYCVSVRVIGVWHLAARRNSFFLRHNEDHVPVKLPVPIRGAVSSVHGGHMLLQTR